MPLAGEIIVAGQIPGERIATAIATSDSATITTTETVVMTVVAPVVVGRTYRVTFDAAFDPDALDDTHVARIREDSVTGAPIQVRRMVVALGNNLQPINSETEYTAVATEDKTFVLTFVRSSGTGGIIMNASAGGPTFLYVDYIRG